MSNSNAINSNSITSSPINNTPIKYRRTLTSDVTQFILQIFIDLFKRGKNYAQTENQVYDKLNAKLQEYLSENKILDVKLDCQRYILKMVASTRTELQSMNQLIDIHKKSKIVPLADKGTRKRQKCSEIDLDDVSIDDMKPKDISHKLWPSYREMEQYYKDWQDELQSAEDELKYDENPDNKENIDPKDGQATGTDIKNTKEPSKKDIERAKKEAVNNFRAKLRTDAIKLMEQRTAYTEQTLAYMQRSVSLLDKIKGEIAERSEERKERRILLQSAQALINRQLKHSQ